jgi:acetylglutamate kinase
MSDAPKPVVVKLGGAILQDADAVGQVWSGLAKLDRPSVIVHGGGPQATALARQLGHEPRMVHGRRVTTDLDLQIALWAYRGELNVRLVAAGLAAGARAVGLSGVDGGIVQVVRRPPREIDGETVDFGWVGDVTGADAAPLRALLAAGFVPVVAPLGVDAAGQVYNVNADTIALEVAAALGAASLVFVAEVGALRRDAGDPATALASISPDEAAVGQADGWISGGMRVKLDVGFEALRRGVGRVRIAAPDAFATDAGTSLLLT